MKSYKTNNGVFMIGQADEIKNDAETLDFGSRT